MHNERCPACKDTVERMLRSIYGEVHSNYHIELGTRPGDYLGTPYHESLVNIFSALQQYRGFTEFVRARYVFADFFVPNPGFVVEFDESQHFTEPRRIALSTYPSDLRIGFSRETWMKHCDEIHAYDNDPPFRDEQRAWYDTLRDFLPAYKGFLPTIRLYAREMEWCKLDTENPRDISVFKNLLMTASDSEIDIILDAFESSLQDVKREYLDWAKDQKNQGIGAPENNGITIDFLTCHSRKIKTASELLQQIRNYCHTIADPNERYQIIREVYCIHPSFHEMWFYDRHFSLFYEPKLGGIYSRLGLKSVSTSMERGTLTGRLNGISTFLLKWVILLDNLYIGKTERSLFDYAPVDDAKLLENIRQLQKNPNPDVNEVIQDLPIIYETIHTILHRTGYSSLDPDIILDNDRVLMYAPCAVNEGPIFHKISQDARRVILKKAMIGDRSLVRKTLEEHFTIRPIASDERKSLKSSSVIQSRAPMTYLEKNQRPLKTSDRKIAAANTVTSNLFGKICKQLDPLFGDLIMDQTTKYTYRGKNVIGYPGKTELDMISLFKHSHSNFDGVKARIYPIVLASRIGQTDLNLIINGLPQHFVAKTERGNPHPGAMFYEGSFTSEAEIEKFLKSVVVG